MAKCKALTGSAVKGLIKLTNEFHCMASPLSYTIILIIENLKRFIIWFYENL